MLATSWFFLPGLAARLGVKEQYRPATPHSCRVVAVKRTLKQDNMLSVINMLSAIHGCEVA